MGGTLVEDYPRWPFIPKFGNVWKSKVGTLPYLTLSSLGIKGHQTWGPRYHQALMPRDVRSYSAVQSLRGKAKGNHSPTL